MEDVERICGVNHAAATAKEAARKQQAKKRAQRYYQQVSMICYIALGVFAGLFGPFVRYGLLPAALVVIGCIIFAWFGRFYDAESRG